MSFEADLALVKDRYPILELVRECQERLGYTSGLVVPQFERDQKTRCPVHADGSPSSKAYFNSNSVYCWVCGRTWDPPALYAAAYGVPLPVALRELLNRMGLATSYSTDDELRALVDAVAPSEPTLDPRAVAVWLDSLWHWCHAHANVASHLEVVLDEIALARSALAEDPAWSMASVRRALEWAETVGELRGCPVPPPPAQGSDALFLLGLPSGG